MDIKTTAKQHTNSARCALGTRAVTPNLDAVPFWRDLIPIFYWLMSSSFISRDAKNRHHNGRNLFNLHKLMNHSEPIV